MINAFVLVLEIDNLSCLVAISEVNKELREVKWDRRNAVSASVCARVHASHTPVQPIVSGSGSNPANAGASLFSWVSTLLLLSLQRQPEIVRSSFSNPKHLLLYLNK